MICPNCRQVNAPGAPFCNSCRTPLTPNPAGAHTSSPFEDSLPAWMQPGTGGSGTTPHPAPGANLGFSIEDLLKATEKAMPTSPAPAARPANFASATPPPPPAPPSTLSLDDLVGGPARSSMSSPAARSAVETPLPAFQEPPLWSQSAAVATTAPRQTNSAFDTTFGTTTETPPSPPAETGVERGHYFVKHGDGEPSIYPPAGFGRRFLGAVIDAIIVGLITGIVVFGLYVFFVSSALNDPEVRRVARFGREALTEVLLRRFALVIGLIAFVGVAFPMFYHVLMVMLGGQTLGHRIMGMRVIKTGGRGVGFLSSFLRAAYGSLPTFISALILLITRVNTDLLSSGLLVVVVFGFLWALFDSNKQGFHDKLARTYVVRSHPI